MNTTTFIMPDHETATVVSQRHNRTPSPAEKPERESLGLPREEAAAPGSLEVNANPNTIRRTIISAPEVLNEAGEYGSAFPRGLRLDFPDGSFNVEVPADTPLLLQTLVYRARVACATGRSWVGPHRFTPCALLLC